MGVGFFGGVGGGFISGGLGNLGLDSFFLGGETSVTSLGLLVSTSVLWLFSEVSLVFSNFSQDWKSKKSKNKNNVNLCIREYH